MIISSGGVFPFTSVQEISALENVQFNEQNLKNFAALSQHSSSDTNPNRIVKTTLIEQNHVYNTPLPIDKKNVLK